MLRRALLATSLLLALNGCASSDGLLTQGWASVENGDVQTGFNFHEDVRLDVPEAGGAERITGTCELRHIASGVDQEHYGVVVSIQRGGEIEDEGLASLTVMQRTDALPEDGRVELELGTSAFASRQGECDIRIDYAVGDGLVGLLGNCQVYGPDAREATATLDLDFAGCTVIEAE